MHPSIKLLNFNTLQKLLYAPFPATVMDILICICAQEMFLMSTLVSRPTPRSKTQGSQATDLYEDIIYLAAYQYSPLKLYLDWSDTFTPHACTLIDKAGHFCSHNNTQNIIDINSNPLSALFPIKCIGCVMGSQIKEEGLLLFIEDLLTF